MDEARESEVVEAREELEQKLDWLKQYGDILFSLRADELIAKTDTRHCCWGHDKKPQRLDSKRAYEKLIVEKTNDILNNLLVEANEVTSSYLNAVQLLSQNQYSLQFSGVAYVKKLAIYQCKSLKLSSTEKNCKFFINKVIIIIIAQHQHSNCTKI